MLLAASSLLLLGPTAQAAPTDGVTATVEKNGAPLVEGSELKSGDNLTFRLQYTTAAQGQTATFELGEMVTFPKDFGANDAVESFVVSEDGHTVTVKFKDAANWPNVSQGFIDLNFKISTVETSESSTIEWGDAVNESIEVVFVKDGDKKQDVKDGFAKAAAPGNLNGFVNPDKFDGTFPGIKAGLEGQVITYTLTVNTPKGMTRKAGFPISDALPAAGLKYATPLAVSVSETTWPVSEYVPVTDNTTRSFDVADSDATTFNGTVDGPIVGPSVMTFTYQVEVTDVAALEAALKAEYEKLNGGTGNFSIGLKNTATFDTDVSKSATVTMGGTIQGVCADCDGNLGKKGDLSTEYLTPNADGSITPPVDITYTFNTDLTRWSNDKGDHFKLNDNMVIADTLGTQQSWNTGSAPIQVFGFSSYPMLTKVDCPASATPAAFGAESFVGEYCVDGKTLLINVGKDLSTNIAFEVKAQLNTVTGLSTEGDIEGGTRYVVPNTAVYHWGSKKTGDKNTHGYVVVPDKDGEAIDDASAFVKSAPGRIQATKGEPLPIPYTFTIDSSRTGVPATSTKIVDYVDTRYFDLGEGTANVKVVGKYNGADLDASHFVVTRDGDKISIELSEAGKLAAAAANGKLEVTLSLITFPFDKDTSESLDITNRAEVYGEDDELMYKSETTSQGSSFGAEAETRKHVFDEITNGGEWSDLLVAGDEANPVFIYRLQFIGHPGFRDVAISPLIDALPEGLKFVGFVSDPAGGPVTDPSVGDLDLPGNLVASYDAAAGTNGSVTISQKADTKFVEGATASVYFAAEVTNDKKLVVNTFDGSEATIIPKRPSIDIEKWTEESEQSGPAYDEYGELTNDGYEGDFDAAPGKKLTAGKDQQIRFTVSNDGPEPLIDVVVSDKLDSGAGEIADLVCTFPDTTADSEMTDTTWSGDFMPGTQFECVGTLPALKAGEHHADTVSVTAIGKLSGKPVDDKDEWHGSVPKIPAPDALEETGSQLAVGAIVLGGLAVIGGTLLLLRRRGAQA